MKTESTANGGDDADVQPWSEPIDANEDGLDCQGVFMQPPQPSTSKDENVYITRDAAGNMVFKDVLANGGSETTLTDLLGAAGGGISEAQHKALRQLIHFIDSGPADGFASGAFRETVGGTFPTSEIWYEDNTKAEKIVELTITRNGNQTPATEVWEMYDTDGSTVLVTVTDTITYSGINEISRTRTIA